MAVADPDDPLPDGVGRGLPVVHAHLRGLRAGPPMLRSVVRRRSQRLERESHRFHDSEGTPLQQHLWRECQARSVQVISFFCLSDYLF